MIVFLVIGPACSPIAGPPNENFGDKQARMEWKLFFSSSSDKEEGENYCDDDDYEDFTLAKKNSEHFDFVSGFSSLMFRTK